MARRRYTGSELPLVQGSQKKAVEILSSAMGLVSSNTAVLKSIVPCNKGNHPSLRYVGGIGTSKITYKCHKCDHTFSVDADVVRLPDEEAKEVQAININELLDTFENFFRSTASSPPKNPTNVSSIKDNRWASIPYSAILDLKDWVKAVIENQIDNDPAAAVMDYESFKDESDLDTKIEEAQQEFMLKDWLWSKEFVSKVFQAPDVAAKYFATPQEVSAMAELIAVENKKKSKGTK